MREVVETKVEDEIRTKMGGVIEEQVLDQGPVREIEIEANAVVETEGTVKDLHGWGILVFLQIYI